MQLHTDIIPDRLARKGEIRNLLVTEMKKQLPEFRLLTWSTGIHYFQRTREYLGHELHETFHIVQSYGDALITCSVSSRLNNIYALSPLYDHGLINPHIDIMSLKKGNNTVGIHESWYRHNGSLESAIRIIALIATDCRTIGVPWLDQRWSDMHSDRLIRFGLHAIELLDHDKITLKNELETQLRKAKGIPTAIHHPVFNEFKRQLNEIAGRPLHGKEKIERLTFDLLELYCNRRIAP